MKAKVEQLEVFIDLKDDLTEVEHFTKSLNLSGKFKEDKETRKRITKLIESEYVELEDFLGESGGIIVKVFTSFLTSWNEVEERVNTEINRIKPVIKKELGIN